MRAAQVCVRRSGLAIDDMTSSMSGTLWAVGAGVGWSLVVNARAVFRRGR